VHCEDDTEKKRTSRTTESGNDPAGTGYGTPVSKWKLYVRSKRTLKQSIRE